MAKKKKGAAANKSSIAPIVPEEFRLPPDRTHFRKETRYLVFWVDNDRGDGESGDELFKAYEDALEWCEEVVTDKGCPSRAYVVPVSVDIPV